MTAINQFQNRAIAFIQKPENRITGSFVFLGKALPFFFQSLAQGSYVALLERASITLVDLSPLRAQLAGAINPLGERIRAAYGDLVYGRLLGIRQAHNPSLEQQLLTIALQCLGFNPRDILSNQVIAGLAIRITTLSLSILAISTLTGAGTFALIGAYYQATTLNALLTFAYAAYSNPQNYPITCEAFTHVLDWLEHAFKAEERRRSL